MTIHMLANWETFGSADGGLHGLPKRSIEVEVDVPIELPSSHVFLLVNHPYPKRPVSDAPIPERWGWEC